MDNRYRKNMDGISNTNNIDGFAAPSRRQPPLNELRNLVPSKSGLADKQYKIEDIHGNLSAKDDSLSGMRRAQTNSQPVSMLNKTLPSRPGSSIYGQKPIAKPTKAKWSKKRKVWSSLLFTLAVIIGAGVWFSSSLIGNLDRVLHGNIFSDVQALFSTTRLNGESQGRVNILLAGYQGSNSDEGALTDSIMIVSLNTQNHTAFTMSIPRDLWLHIPGLGYQRINDANTQTSFNQSGYFQGGMGQLQQIIEQDFHIPIDYYSLIDYTAFKDAVNAVGGITVNIQSPDPRGLYDPNVDKAHGGPVKLPNGPAHLDGMQALALALARGDSFYAYGFPQSDINRTQHQRQMLIALEQKALSAGVLSNPITITHLVDAFGNNVKTNLSLADVLRLAQLAKKVNVANIKSYGLSYGGSSALLQTYNAYGQDVLIPKAGLSNYSQIQNFYKLLTTANSPTK